MIKWGEEEIDGKLNRLIKANECVKENWLQINEIKGALSSKDYMYSAQLWRELSDEERESLNIAPTKGAIFTIEENKKMASKEFREAVKQYYEEKNNG